jgi:phosphate transport system permease protein
MTTSTFPVGSPTGVSAESVGLAGSRTWRTTKSAIMSALMGLSLLLVLIPLVLVLVVVVQKGADAMSWSFLTKDIPVRARQIGPGMGPAIVGTLIITFVATLIAVPTGILGAIYLNEYGGTGLFARVVRFMATVMTGVPSIVMGIFIYVSYTVRRGTNGFQGFGGSLALAALMLPIIIRSVEEMLRLVPENLREASMGLGATKSRTVLTVVLPAALPGVISGCLLAVARAAGETAPLIFTIGVAKSLNTNPVKGPMAALPREIFANAQEPFLGANQRAWGAALTLIVIAFLLTVFARLISSRFALKR